MTPHPTAGATDTDIRQQSREAILSLGSNLGDRLARINQACDALAALPETRLTARSPVYETDPVDVPARFSGDLYLNCVVIVETRLPPSAFSDALHAVEVRLGRTRGAALHLPRTLDIDILAIDDLVSDSPELTLPHPRAHVRRFVLQPLADLRPDYRFPGQSQTVSRLLQDLPATPRAARYRESAPVHR